MSLSPPSNPYESPRDAAPRHPDFKDPEAAELADLRRRVLELERQMGRSWFFHRNFFVRIFAVWGYFLLGYLFMVFVVLTVMTVVWLITGEWPS